MSEILEKIKQIITKHKVSSKHSDFQIENFMIGKEYTKQSKIWQCIRELQNRYESLQNLELELEQAKDNIELQKLKIQKTKLKLPKSNVLEIKFIEEKEIQIVVRKKERLLKTLESTLNKLEDKKEVLLAESKKILEIFNNLAKDSEVLDWDNQTAQNEYWNTKFKYELNVYTLLGHPINPELAKSILSLPDTAPIRSQFAAALIENQKKLTEKNK